MNPRLRLVGLAVLGSLLPAAAPADEATPITAGAVIERKMEPGETHRYEFALREGDYVQVAVEQKGVDVAQVVTGPDGRTLLETDSSSVDHGPDPLAFVAPAAGRFVLSLGASSRISPGASYELRVEAVRGPTEGDLLRAQTIRAIADGARLLEQPGEHSRQALGLYLEGVRGWQELGEPRLRMWSEHDVGYVLGEFLDRHTEAFEYHQRALASAREVGDSFAEAYLLEPVGVSHRRQGRFEEARACLEEALRLHRAAGRRAREAHVLIALGSLFNASGDFQPALDRLHEALQLYARTGRALDAAVARINVAAAYLRLGEYERALEHYRRALPSFENEPRLRARAITEMASAHSALGDRTTARGSLEEALGIYRALENRGMEASTSVTLATIEREEGNLDPARRRLERAAGVLHASGERMMEARAQCELGETRRALGDPRAARAAFEAVRALLSDPGAPEAACAEAGLARVARDEGLLRAARAHADRALEAAESLRWSLASMQTRASALGRQQALYELAVDVRMRQHEAEPAAGHDRAALEVAERARARSLLELLSEIRVDIREGVDPDLLAEERAVRSSLNARAEAQAQAVAAKKMDGAEALGQEVASLATRLAEVEARIRRLSPRYAALSQPRPLSAAEIQQQVLDDDTLLLEYALGETASYLWVVSTAGVRTYTLAPRAEIEAAAQAVYEWFRALSAATLSPRRGGEFQREAATLSRLVLGPGAEALGDRRLLVVAPGMLQYVPFGALPDPRTLSPTPPFPYVPLLARHEIVKAPSASVVAVIRREASGRPAGGRSVAVLADPVYEASDPRVRPRPARAARRGRASSASEEAPGAEPIAAIEGAEGRPPSALERALRSLGGTTDRSTLSRLPFSRQEADSIAGLAPPGSVRKVLGFEATRETALSPELARYRILHLAVHGLLDAERPELSGMVLSLVDEEGRPKDGFLRLHDVYNMKLAADLVVLSGCQTGLGKAVHGEGLVGLTRGFMYAGARRVVASLWPVDDLATSELMSRFYRGMLKEKRTPPAALRVAQLEMSRRAPWRDPYYWAGFVLHGDWN
jgi:CHAT domain-containing protein